MGKLKKFKQFFNSNAVSNTSWPRWQETTVGDLQTEMVGTTTVLGRDKSVVVEFNGEKAVSGPGKVTFPAMDRETVLDTPTLKLFRGWVDTEAAALRFTNRTFFNSKLGLQKSNPYLYDVFKAVETARVEYAYTRLYVGAGKNLAQLSDALLDKVLELVPFAAPTAHNPQAFNPVAINMLARHRMPGVYNDFGVFRLAKHIDRPKVKAWVDELEGFSTTQESFALAERICQQDPQDQPPPQQAPGEGEGDGEGAPQSGAAVARPFPSMEDVINAEVEKLKGQPNGGGMWGQKDEDGPFVPYSTQWDQTYHWQKDNWRENVSRYMVVKDDMGAQLATAKRRLELLIQATQKISYDTRKEQGRMDSRRLVGAYNGEADVFKLKRDTSALDTAVSVCVDLSGSMGHQGGWDGIPKSHYAFQATIVLAELLHKIGVPLEIVGYDSEHNLLPFEEQRKLMGRGMTENYGRVDPLKFHELKLFKDRFFDARKFLARVEDLTDAGGGTPAGEILTTVGKRLRGRPEKRKIMFVLSDGDPGMNGNQPRQRGHLKRTVKQLERYMDVVGVGIQQKGIGNFFETHIVLENPKNLPETMLDLLSERLLPGRKKVALAA